MKKIISIAVALFIILSMMVCGEATQVNEMTFSGTVKSVEEDTITVTTDDGSEKTFTVNDSTVYSMEMDEMPGGQQNGSAPQMPSGDQQNGSVPQMASGDQQNGSAPQMPSGDQQNGTAPQMPSGDQQNGTAPQMPSGNQQNGSAPQMPSGNQQNGTAPQMPSGDQQNGSAPQMPSGDQQNGTAPQMPSGDQQNGNVPEMPTGDANGMAAGYDMLTVGTSVTVTVDDENIATEIGIKMSGAPAGGFGSGSADIEYTSVNTYSEDASMNGQTYTSTGKDENAVLVTGGVVTLDSAVIERTSSESTGGDNASFYGVGAAVLTTDGTVCVSDSEIATDAAGGTGVFAYGSGTAYVSDTTITTKQNTSGGIHVAGGGTLYAWDLNVDTSGESAAAIRSDRGSGTMVVEGGSYTSNGIGSPAVYSTADISVNNAVLTANASEAICIEGKNSIRLYDCALSGNMSDDSRNDCTWNVILYQSMSGDSDIGNSLFEMVGGTLTARNGGVFYTTNTQSTFVISGVDIITSDDCEFLLKCTGNGNQRGWGSAGANGASCTFSALNQSMTGDVIWDSISTLDMYLADGSTLTGAFLNDETNAVSGGNGYAALNVAEGCTWVVTKDSVLSTLTSSGSVVDENGLQVTIIGADGTIYVSGDSDVTVTVEAFADSADLSGCAEISCFDDFAVEKI